MSHIDQQGLSLDSFPDLSLLFIPTLIDLWAFDLVSSLVWWETLANIDTLFTAKLSKLNPTSRCRIRLTNKGRIPHHVVAFALHQLDMPKGPFKDH